MNANGSPGGGGPVVQHLPPVTLRVAFPPGYPDDGPPAARLLAEWLAPAQAASLQLRLMDVWEEQGPGVPVVYAWVEWLEAEALSWLGISDTLTLAALEPLPQQGESQQGEALEREQHDNGRQACAGAADPGSAPVNGSAPAPASAAAGHDAEVSGGPARGRAGGAKFGDEGASSSSSGSSDGEADDERGARLGQAGQGKGGSGPDALLLRLLAYSAYREAHLFRQVRGGSASFVETAGVLGPTNAIGPASAILPQAGGMRGFGRRARALRDSPRCSLPAVVQSEPASRGVWWSHS